MATIKSTIKKSMTLKSTMANDMTLKSTMANNMIIRSTIHDSQPTGGIGVMKVGTTFEVG